jgi:predicted ATP-dependent endonuclease of OLD family
VTLTRRAEIWWYDFQFGNQRIRESTLTQFLPAIKGVKVSVASEARARALRSSEIYVNDGTETKLEFKWDGVQSLAAIALMRHASQKGAGSKHVIVAVEEPESHLHPSAIHGLKSVLQELAKEQQIVITSHPPIRRSIEYRR